jgi:hypothetical protein
LFPWCRVDDRETVDIDDQVAIVGAEAIAQYRVPAELNHLPSDVAARHRDWIEYKATFP